MSLKKQMKDLQQEVDYKNQEINTMKKNIKYTTYQEINSENQVLQGELLKCKKIIDEQINQKAQNNNYFDKANDLEKNTSNQNHNMKIYKNNTLMHNKIQKYMKKNICNQNFNIIVFQKKFVFINKKFINQK
ncbi:hypothetical protein IMG5_112700 [Ichthyophthirius multifiliis]|uniref:Uncharacterized protein n=1 Tax=Ichthyophthirius multifiliis TaxID=5932 RepID=G0QTX4_ICHMU|nr:hypothetical protein IMG5_112700 [Ichthyophthirius multifiliis]EGR31333.1 hypothetical protein IMG5_112700 [Ichthyophthirius multifiliis]|eukprot:XP_004034819.1 hypothetical protein IMG5_112700 [Ichthyophthirius multifiliis]